MHTALRSSFTILAVLAVGLSGACNKGDNAKTEAADKAKAGEEAATKAGSASSGMGISFASALPQSTVGVWVMRDPAAFIDTNIRPALMKIKDVKKGLTIAALGSQAMLGEDLTDFSSFAKFGIDVHGEWGIALLAEAGMVSALHVPLTSAADFEKAVASLSSKIGEVVWKKSGNAKHGKIAGADVILVGKSAFLVTSATPPREALAKGVAALIAVDPAKSLATNQRFKDDWAAFASDRAATKATAGVALKNVAGWVHAGPVMDILLKREIANMAGEFESRQAAALAAAKAASNTEAVAKIEASIAQEKKSFDFRAARRKARNDLFKNLLGGVESIVGAGDLGSYGLDGALRASLRKDRTVAKLLAPATGTPAVVQRLAKQPEVLVFATVNKAQAKSLLNMMLAIDWSSFEKLSAEIQEFSGVSIAEEVWPALSGEVGYVMRFDRKEILEGNGSKGVAGALMFKVTDSAKLKGAFEKMVTKGIVTKGKTDGSWDLKVPDWYTVKVVLEADWLTLDTGGTLTSGKSFTSALPDTQKARFEATNASVLLSWKHLTSGYLFFASSNDQPLTVTESLAGKDEAKTKQLMTLLTAMNKDQKDASTARISGLMSLMDLLGGFVINATPAKSKTGDVAWLAAGGMHTGSLTIEQTIGKGFEAYQAMMKAEQGHSNKRRTDRMAADKLASEIGVSVSSIWGDVRTTVTAEQPAKTEVAPKANVVPKAP